MMRHVIYAAMIVVAILGGAAWLSSTHAADCMFTDTWMEQARVEMDICSTETRAGKGAIMSGNGCKGLNSMAQAVVHHRSSDVLPACGRERMKEATALMIDMIAVINRATSELNR